MTVPDSANSRIGASKAKAHEFLQQLEATLKSRLPPAAEMEAWVRRTVASAKADDTKKHLYAPEAALLNGQVLPVVYS